MSEPWAIRKNGYFYRENWCGYTSSHADAGRYSREEAEQHAENTEGVTAHPFSDFVTSTHPVHLALTHITAKIKDLSDDSLSSMAESVCDGRIIEELKTVRRILGGS